MAACGVFPISSRLGNPFIVDSLLLVSAVLFRN